MADGMPNMGLLPFVDKRATRGQSSVTFAEYANFKDVAAMKARLTALKPASYTTARLNNMTVNDLQYALRLESADAAGIK